MVLLGGRNRELLFRLSLIALLLRPFVSNNNNNESNVRCGYIRGLIQEENMKSSQDKKDQQ